MTAESRNASQTVAMRRPTARKPFPSGTVFCVNGRIPGNADRTRAERLFPDTPFDPISEKQPFRLTETSKEKEKPAILKQ